MQKNNYDVAYERAADPAQRENYWKEQAEKVSWFQFPNQILDASNLCFARWFVDGKINITYNMFDRFLKEHGSKRAVIWVSNMVNKEQVWTLQEAYQNVCRGCSLLIKHGVKKGDRVIIYLPMIPEALFMAWACARIGAVHSIVFGGFAALQLASRIQDTQACLIVTTTFGLQPHKKVNYTTILIEALKISNMNPKVLIYQRPDLTLEVPKQWIEFSLNQIDFVDVPCEEMDSNDYLYILYTSGTTKAPKGIVRDHGGTTVALEWTMNHIMGINAGNTYFAASDIGWVVGHSFTIYGPLLRGAATLLYEGKPTFPNPGALWKIISDYKVNGLYTSPTALRAIRKEDNKGEWFKKWQTTSLQSVSLAGERCDVHTYQWIERNLNVLINDNYWQTECGWIISCNYMNLHTFNVKAGSAIKPCPGFQVEILDKDNQRVPQEKQGKICIKLPMPPSFMLTLYRKDDIFLQEYMKTPGYYTTGDAGYFDSDGYLNVMTRLDDVINTASHRLSTAYMEEIIMSHPKILEAAVVAKIDQNKGQIPVGFIILKNGQKGDNIEKELISLIREKIGPVASFQHAILVEKLPKTKTGKIIRHVLRSIIEGEHYKCPATIEDQSVLNSVEKIVKQYGRGLGKKAQLTYRSEVDGKTSKQLQKDYEQNDYGCRKQFKKDL